MYQQELSTIGGPEYFGIDEEQEKILTQLLKI